MDKEELARRPQTAKKIQQAKQISAWINSGMLPLNAKLRKISSWDQCQFYPEDLRGRAQ